MRARQAFRAHIPATLSRCPMASHCQAVQGSNRATTYQNARASFDRKTDQLHQPAHRAVLQVDGSVIPSGSARIHHRREKLGQHTDGRASWIDPGSESRMLVAHGMRQDMLLEEIKERFGRSPVLRQLLIEHQLAPRWWHRAKTRLPAAALP